MTNIKSKNRIIWIDIAKAICILLVVITHSSYCNDIFRVIFEPFFLALFFFLSGYVYSDKYEFKDFLIKKIKTIIVPWFIFGVINILLSQCFSFNTHKSLQEEFIGMICQIRGFNDECWFLACLFISFIPFYFIIKWFKEKSILITFILSVFSIIYCKYARINLFGLNTNHLPWHIQTIGIVDFFLTIGYYYKIKYEVIINRYMNSIGLLVTMIVYSAIAYVNYCYTKTIVSINAYNANICIWYVLSILGILAAVYSIKKIPNNKFLSFIGTNSILYYCMHGKVLSILEAILSKVGVYNVVCGKIIGEIFSVVGISICVSIILIIPCIIINKYFPFIIGREYKKRS